MFLANDMVGMKPRIVDVNRAPCITSTPEARHLFEAVRALCVGA